MILISHRGNTSGPIPNWENEPTYIDKAISEGFDVEVDVWYKDNILYLGHDEPQYSIDFNWFKERITKLWIHCKNIDAINFFLGFDDKFNYFWHENDTLTLTSLKYIWAYPGKQPINKSIAVMPEINNDDISKCLGICSDNIKNYDTINLRN
jgi:hypothetical protein